VNAAVTWFLIVAGAVLILLEVLLGAVSGFDLFLLGSAILIGGVLGLLTGNPLVALAAAGLLSLVYVLVGRKRIRSRLRRPGILTNTDALLGRIAHVSEAIPFERTGRVRLDGEEWRARGDSPATGRLEIGTRVRIQRVDGVTLTVVPAEEPAGQGGTG
jgi:membrane protein implicated in regulation of membrane protease activity